MKKITFLLLFIPSILLAQDSIVWDFETDLEGWYVPDQEGQDRDLKVSWDSSGSLLMTYFDNSPDKGPQLWFPGFEVQHEFEAKDYPYLEIHFETIDWPTDASVKFLIEITDTNDKMVYSFTDFDPKLNFISVDIASFDPGWGQSYAGPMKALRIELPHNGDPASNPSGNWYSSWTMIDKIILAGEKSTTGISQLVEEDFSFYPNPASTSINLSVNADNVSIYNISGKLVRKVEHTTRNISVEGLLSGLYFVKIEANGVSRTKKLMIQ